MSTFNNKLIFSTPYPNIIIIKSLKICIVALLIFNPWILSSDSSELDQNLVTIYPGLKIKYVTKVEYTILLEGDIRSPTGGFARPIEYSVIDHDSINHIVTMEMKSETTSYLFNSTMKSFGTDIIIIPDWNYWRTNITDKLNYIIENNPTDTSLTTKIIDDNTIFGYRIEINSFNKESGTTRTVISEFTYEKNYGVLSYQLLYTEIEFSDGSREISESILKLESNHNVVEPSNLSQIYLIMLIIIFVVSVTISLIVNKIQKRKSKTGT